MIAAYYNKRGDNNGGDYQYEKYNDNKVMIINVLMIVDDVDDSNHYYNAEDVEKV